MALTKTSLEIDDFVLEMQNVSPACLCLEQLQDWVSRLKLRDNLSQHISFCSQGYRRKLLYRTQQFDMLLLCWQPGQFSTIHDHGDSLNVTRVYQGVLTSRLFEKAAIQKAARVRCLRKDADSYPLQLRRQEYLQKDDLTLVDRHQIHQLANTSDQNLVTLHVYARPLQSIRVYSPKAGRSEQVAVQYDLAS